MPLFEFRCVQCGAEFEKLVRKTGEAAQITCPVCQGSKVEETFSTFASLTGNAAPGSRSGGCRPAGG